jgi:hypothetical protein
MEPQEMDEVMLLTESEPRRKDGPGIDGRRKYVAAAGIA